MNLKEFYTKRFLSNYNDLSVIEFTNKGIEKDKELLVVVRNLKDKIDNEMKDDKSVNETSDVVMNKRGRKRNS